MNKLFFKRAGIALLLAAAAGVLYFTMLRLEGPSLPETIAMGNGRIEATMVDIETKLPGRLSEITVKEGDMVKKGELLAAMDTDELDARYAQALAQVRQAEQQRKLALSVVKQRESERTLARKNLERSKNLYVNKNIPLVQLQQHESALNVTEAALEAARAQVVSADAAIDAARAQADTIKANLEESRLYAPIDGRILYRLREPGEIIGGGGKVLTLLDLTDVYMTIFLPTAQAGRIDIGSDARIILDARPDIAIPAVVTFVSPQAQFTPKEIETQSEREKLMFRIKVKVDEALLRRYLERVKIGLPGTAYVRTDAQTPWPESLNRLPGDDQTP
ncbi:efflux RND transporter periplasmic adaptor subunit [Sulfurimonas diazotrophicus]|uniref:Efflux RND transporter periplasmic adaptor subunit n=1 Tax=Sulfurimonas diazotrophicus TaxID=3131939 RepID=A0ABZ3H9B8_9BACT